VAAGWLSGREPAEAAREILMTAGAMTPSAREVAIRIAESVSDAALPVWRETAAAPCVGRAAQHRHGGSAEGSAGGVPPGDLAQRAAAGSGHAGKLHSVILALFGWDGDHLYEFTVGKQRYSGAFGHLEEKGYDHEIRIAAALSGVRKIGYVYGLGACWEHEITQKKKLRCTRGGHIRSVSRSLATPRSSTRRRTGDGPKQPEPFDIDEVNRRLTGDEDR
jgi:hypothetical protein